MGTERDSAVQAHNARLGLALFGVYVVLYGSFILLAVFRPSVMALQLIGVNIAIVYGFTLILGALALALVYMALARTEDAA